MSKEIIRELELYNIRANDNRSYTLYSEGKYTHLSLQDIEKLIVGDVNKNGELLNKIVGHLFTSVLTSVTFAKTPPSIISQNIFINTIKSLHSIVTSNAELEKHETIILNTLNTDVTLYSESYISEVNKAYLYMKWLVRLIRYDMYRLYLLANANGKVYRVAQVQTGTTGGWGSPNVPMSDRMYKYEDWERQEDDTKNSPTWKQWRRRYTAHKDKDWDEGFKLEDKYFRSKNSPFVWTNQKENPYRSYQSGITQ